MTTIKNKVSKIKESHLSPELVRKLNNQTGSTEEYRKKSVPISEEDLSLTLRIKLNSLINGGGGTAPGGGGTIPDNGSTPPSNGDDGTTPDAPGTVPDGGGTTPGNGSGGADAGVISPEIIENIKKLDKRLRELERVQFLESGQTPPDLYEEIEFGGNGADVDSGISTLVAKMEERIKELEKVQFYFI